MEIWIVSYTAHGRDTAERVADALEQAGHDCRRFALPKFLKAGDEPLLVSAAQWAGDGFARADALIFVCASGIAVRAIAPWVRDKKTDPAVLVLDEKGTFAIPLLSGHLGGANALADTLSKTLGATPVITTATDSATHIHTSACVRVSIEVDPNSVLHTSPVRFEDVENIFMRR